MAKETAIQNSEGAMGISTVLQTVYQWMFASLLLTGMTAFYTVQHLIGYMIEHPTMFYLLAIAEVLLVVGITVKLEKLSFAQVLFGLTVYASLNGVVMAMVLIQYQIESIYQAFFLTSVTFLLMSFIKKDITTWGRTLYSILFGLVIATFANMFFHNALIESILNYVGVFLFMGLTAYDTQKIKKDAKEKLPLLTEEEAQKRCCMYALDLYLDFVNLFLYILRIFGKRR